MRGLHGREIFHQLIPTLSAAGAEKEYQGLRHISEIEIVVFVATKLGEAESLSHSDGIYEEQYEPRSQEVANRCKTSRGSLEELIELVIPWNDKEGDGHEE